MIEVRCKPSTLRFDKTVSIYEGWKETQVSLL
jgi:hypothetical protein